VIFINIFYVTALRPYRLRGMKFLAPRMQEVADGSNIATEKQFITGQ
jgi:hypothetical protein